MRKNKSIQCKAFVLVALISFFSSSCARFKFWDTEIIPNEDSSQTGSLTYSELIGTWQTPCFFDNDDNVYVKLTLSLTSGNDFQTIINHYASNDATCAGSLEPSSHSVSGPVTLGSETTPGIYNFDTEITGFAIIYNIITSPQPGVINLGLMDSNHDGLSPSTRPVQIDNQLTFTKQSKLAYLDLVGTWISNCFNHLNVDYRIMSTIWDNHLGFQTYIEMYDSNDTNCSGPMNGNMTVIGTGSFGAEISPGVYAYEANVTTPGTFTVYNLLYFPTSGSVRFGLFDGQHDGTSPSTRPVQVDNNITFIKQ